MMPRLLISVCLVALFFSVPAAAQDFREGLRAFQRGGITLPYLRHLSVNRAMPGLRSHLHLPAEFGPNWVLHSALDRLSGPELFIGQQNTSFGHLHQDQVSVHIGFVQLQGAKEFVIYAPEDTPHLHTFEGREFPYQQRNSKVRFNGGWPSVSAAIKSLTSFSRNVRL